MSEIDGNEKKTKLAKSLNLWDVIAYGIGSTVGAGIFVITGQGVLFILFFYFHFSMTFLLKI